MFVTSIENKVGEYIKLKGSVSCKKYCKKNLKRVNT